MQYQFVKHLLRTGLCLAVALSSLIATQSANALDSIEEIKRLSQDTKFKKALDLVFTKMQSDAVAWNGLSKRQKEMISRDLQGYLRQLRQSRNPRMRPPSSLAEVGLTLSSGFGRELMELGRYFRDAYPSIDSTSEVAQASYDSTYTSQGIEYGFSDIDDNYCEEVDCECTARCNEEYRAAYNQAGFEWFGGSIKNLDFLALILGYYELVDQIYELQRQRLDCLEQCSGIDYINRCYDDSDCDSTQYCHHTFGNPYHTCRDKKAEGETCSRHAKCASNCCKWRPLSNPFSKICRPANRCN